MSIHNRPFEAIEESDLRVLVDDRVQEAKSIEYKQALPGNSDGEKKEFLYDVTSFANASGGLLIYGMREKDGRAEEVVGLDAVDLDARILRLQNVILSGVDPRILGLGIKAVPLGSGRVAILIRVPKSWALPHMVKYGGSSKFYSRNSAGKYPLDVAELRSLFALSETTAEHIRNFRAERLAKIIASETPTPMDEHPRVVLHIIPLGAFDPAAKFDLSSLKYETDHFRPMRASEWNGPRHNFDGMYTYATREKRARAYVQLFRNGIVEAVDTSMLSYEGDRRVLPAAYEKVVLDGLKRYLSLQISLGVEPPCLVMLSLSGVRGYTIGTNAESYFDTQPIDRDVLLVQETLLQSFDEDLPGTMRPAFDAVWNAAGWERSMNYDVEGNWQGK